MLEHQRDLEAMQAEYDVYAEEETKMSAEVRERKEITSSQPRHNTAPCAQILYGTLVPPHSEKQSEQKLNEATLVQAFKESLMMTRLPAPEPSVFTGDPLAFTEWQTSFKALIETTCTSPAHKLFYLRKYISGDALSVLEGTFYRSDEEAYTQAWDALNKRYGHPFIVQRAFRGKLGSWPKIGPKEPLRLREFSDFLVSCKNAMPHISGLKVLDDCEENQKLLQKLPDWATARWNRLVTKELDDGKPYPSFEVFSNFLSEEARIACNPVSSLHALKRTEEKAGTEAKCIKTRILVTTTRVAQGKGHPSKDSASHRGGIWERQIRTTRSVMSSVLAQAKGRLDDSSLRMFFYEAMFIVNSRPLTTNTLADPKSIEPLTLNHLLTMKPTTPLPPPGRFVQEDLYARKRWRKVQYLSEQFWSRWRREYLTNISLRQQWHTTRRNVQVGDIVIVKDENTPRNEWPLSKVVEAQEDDDGLVRKVKIQVGQNKLGPKGERLTQPSFLERPVQKLVVLVEHK
ncbi:hypothetical protein SRHO_G00002490 [Serrasalmus rhombeus]